MAASELLTCSHCGLSYRRYSTNVCWVEKQRTAQAPGALLSYSASTCIPGELLGYSAEALSSHSAGLTAFLSFLSSCGSHPVSHTSFELRTLKACVSIFSAPSARGTDGPPAVTLSPLNPNVLKSERKTHAHQ